ncbi:MAG: glycerol-3-phosphate acyltransferase [Dehalococcoidales bacterium]|nr:MAG: glycerol-3-phosphate acyltransferase [Dehalococcoidales bacterium]
MQIVSTISAVLVGYLLGSIPSAYIAARIKGGVDIRQVGGGNMGALNVMREVDRGAGYAVWIADMAKGMLAVYIARWLGLSPVWVYAAGFAAIVGHNWPIFLKFRGGKGGATTLGILLVLVPRELGISFGITCVVVFITHNPVLGLYIALTPLPVFVWLINGSGELVSYTVFLAAFLAIRYAVSGLQKSRSGTDIKKGIIFDKEYSIWQARKK